MVGTPSSPSEDFFPHPHLLPAGKTLVVFIFTEMSFYFISAAQHQTFSPLKTGGEYSKSTEALIGSVCSTFRSDNLSVTSIEVIPFILTPSQKWKDRTMNYI